MGELSGVVRLAGEPASGYGRVALGVAGLMVPLGTTADTAAAGSHGHSVASEEAAGFMAAADKVKLNAVDTTPLEFDAPLSVDGHRVSVGAATTTQAGDDERGG